MAQAKVFLRRSRGFLTVLLVSAVAGALLEGLRESGAQGPAPAGLDVRLTQAEGIVDVRFQGEPDWAPAQDDTPLEAGDEVRAGAGSRAEIGWGGQSLYELEESGDLVLSQSDQDKKTFDLREGTLLLEIKKHEPGETVEVRTPFLTARDVDTDYGVTRKPDGTTAVGVFSGEVEATVQNGPAALPPSTVDVFAGKEYTTALSAYAPRPLQTLLLFQDRIPVLIARRIVERRDWKGMSEAQREDLRKSLYDDRVKNAAARQQRLSQEQADAKAAQLKADAAPSRRARHKRRHKRARRPADQ